MANDFTRRSFIAVGAAATIAGNTRFVHSEPGATGSDPGATFPSTDPALANEIVLVSHFSIDRVSELLKDDRSLALASWDWGFGDWESALGAASHVGNREIADTLIDHGARPNLFTFAMMDMVDAVRAACELRPGIQGTNGPHGITLLEHAQNGKANRVVEYLHKFGGANAADVSLELSEAAGDVYLGTYAFSGCGDDPLVVARCKGTSGLGIKRSSGSIRRMNRTGEHTFTPAGAPQVTIRFSVSSEQATGLTIHRGKPLLAAKRIKT